MGILITTYKSLPEQVEANKEKCEDLQEQINNIDTSEIDAIKQQVEDNTHDITSLTNGLSVTNGLVANHTQRLNDIDSALDTKVNKVTEYALSTIKINPASNALDIRRSEGDTDSLSETYVNHGTNNLTEGWKYSEDGDMINRAQVTYDEYGINFYKTGAEFKVDNKVIITEDNISQYVTQQHLYRHRIKFSYPYEHSYSIITNDNTPFTLATLVQWLSDNGYTSQYPLETRSYNNTNNVLHIHNLYVSGVALYNAGKKFTFSSTTSGTVTINGYSQTGSEFTDDVIQIA